MPQKSRKPGRTSSLADVNEIAQALPDEALANLLEFAGYLAQKYPPEEVTTLEIVPIERPEQESVIAAIRRLTKTYPMLEKEILFQQTSQAMSDHVLKDISERASIDRLEVVFRDEYEALLNKQNL